MYRRFLKLVGNNKLLPPDLYNAGGDAVTAHPHLDANTGRLCLWSYRVGDQVRSVLLCTAVH